MVSANQLSRNATSPRRLSRSRASALRLPPKVRKDPVPSLLRKDASCQNCRERSFERQLRALIEDAREAGDFVEGAEFILARDPKIGSPVDDGIWFLPMAPIGRVQIALYYTFDDSTVTLLAIAIV